MNHWMKRTLFCLALITLCAVAFACATAESSGTWGDLTWTLDDEGLLTIQGSGNMNDIYWENRDTDAWLSEKNSIKSVIIESDVTSIGHSAFYGCSSLTSMTIPEGVTSIGDSAFSGCSSLTSVTIPESVTSIGESAFSGCSSLTSVTIPESVTSIGESAFDSCNKLTSVTIPESVTSIGKYAFNDCSSLRSVTISQGVTSIGDYAFYWCEHINLYMPESVEPSEDTLPWYYTGTIYCHQFSKADSWATEHKYNVIYVDNLPGEVWYIGLPEDFRLACGIERRLMPGVLGKIVNPVINWSSETPEVASVSADGVVKALKPGTAVITASSGDVSASVTVTTYAVAEDFTLPDEALVATYGSLQLTPGIVPEGAGLDLVWMSDDPNVAVVNESGRVIGEKPGDAVITATDSATGLSRSVRVHVCYPVTAIEFTPAAQEIGVGKSLQLTANVTMRDESVVNQLVYFESNNGSVATVDAEGRVTGRGPGKAVITAWAENGVSASCEITVREPNVFTLPANLVRIESGAFAGLTLPGAGLGRGPRVSDGRGVKGSCHALLSK